MRVPEGVSQGPRAKVSQNQKQTWGVAAGEAGQKEGIWEAVKPERGAGRGVRLQRADLGVLAGQPGLATRGSRG